MTHTELLKLADEVYDMNINPDPNTLTMAMLEMRSALLKVIRHLQEKPRAAKEHDND